MEIISGLIVEVVKCTYGPVKRHLCYFFNHEGKLKFLNDQLQKLKKENERMEHRADEATRQGRQIEQDVQNWRTNVEKKIKEDAEELQKYEDETKKRCFVGLCPDLMSRYHVSKKAEEEAILVAQLLAQAEQFSTKEISFGPDPQQMVATSAQRGFETFQSREDVLQDILTALKDPSIQRIGVFGMGGVGKTMLMKEVASIAKRDSLFDEVAIATISNSQKTDTMKAQGEIADALGLTLGQETESGRAIGLRQRLNNGKKILVILDDIWEKVDLEVTGIIFEQNQNMCKLLLTSRSIDTLRTHMNVGRTFELTILSSEESMLLFTKIVGNKAEEPDFKRVAIDVVAKCAGLPVAISAVAKALKEKNIDIWKNALQQLKRANPERIDQGVEKRVYSALKLSYEYLQFKPAQTLLLLCSLLPQGQEFSISDLIKYSWSMVLPEDVCSMKEARGNMAVLIQELKSSSLLLSGDIDTVFRMHDVVRDVCISIAREDNQMFVFDEQIHFEKLLEGRKLKNCMALSLLAYGDIGELPEKLNCPELQFFCCSSKDGSLESKGISRYITQKNRYNTPSRLELRKFKVPGVFFEETKELKVLHLTGMELSRLPSPFLSLTKLQTLCLDHCILQDIAIVGELKNLEVLSIANCGITKLPIQLANLSNLELLDLSKCHALKVIPSTLISSLRLLEELYMSDRFDRWDIEGNASLSELKCLNKLTALDISIRDVRIIPKDLFSQNLERYKIRIGGRHLRYGKLERSRLLQVELNITMYLDDGIEMLLKSAEDLRFIMPLKGIMKLISMLNDTGKHLKDLCIENSQNEEITETSLLSKSEEEIIETSSLMVPLFSHKVMLCLLENFELNGINNPSIWNNEPSTWPTNLTSLRVHKCNNLKHLFSTSMARCLKQLKDLKVEYCQNMIDIIATEMEEKRDVILFPNLDSLYLDELPNLTRFSRNLIEFSSLRKLYITRCCVLKSFISDATTVKTLVREEAERNDFEEDENFNILTLFNERVSFPKLKSLEIGSLNSLRKIWHEQLSPESFNNINYFSLRYCQKLLNVFPIQMLAKLQRLDYLEIYECNLLEEIFEREKPNLGKSTAIKYELPTLTHLRIQNLPNLRSLSHKAIECPSLRRIWMYFCDQVQLLFCSEEYIGFGKPQQKNESQQPFFWVNKIGFPSVEELRLEYDKNLEQIWEGQLPSQCFPKLRRMALSSMNKLSCEGLKGFLSIVQLSELILYDIDDLIRLAWDEKSEPFLQVFNKLTTLEVLSFKEFKNSLVPSSMSFSNLVNMTISSCIGLISLLTHSTAKSLVHFTAMKISSCDEIKEIIAKDGAEDDIIFPQLKSVELRRLKKLEAFCMGNCSMKFLSLDEFTVIECPKMRVFCQGEVVTPKLQNVKLGGKTQWSVNDGGLNISIQQVYERQV